MREDVPLNKEKSMVSRMEGSASRLPPLGLPYALPYWRVRGRPVL